MQLQLPFCAKELPNGKKLYRRKRGYTFTLNASTTTVHTITVPYSEAKINEVELLWFPEGITVDMKVKDSTTGTYSTIPNYTFNQFGFNVVIEKDFYKDLSQYDADVYMNMQIEFTFTNSTEISKTVGLNMIFHEVI